MEKLEKFKNRNLLVDSTEITCINCWGHQEYLDDYIVKIVDLGREHNDNFISKFVKKYIRKS